MKDLKDIILEKININEKLIINKNTKIKNIFVDTILRFIYSEPEDAEDDEVNAITHWVEEENVEHLIILSTLNVFEKYGLIDPDNDYLEKDLRKDFENDNIEILLEDKLYNGYYANSLGEEIYTDKYEHNSLYKNDKNHTLTYKIKNIGNIFFINKK